MTSDYYQLAAEGWHIITRHSESRKSARKLLRWLAETLQIGVAEIRFHDSRTSYSWREKVERIPSVVLSEGSDEIWNHPFPTGNSSWTFSGFDGDRIALGQLLDLLADQWLRINNPERDSQKLETAASKVNPAWISVSRPTRRIRTRLRQLSHSMNPLLIHGEVGTGKSYLAALIHREGPIPTLPLTGINSLEITGTLFVSDWWNIRESKRRVLLNDPRRLIAAADRDSNLSPELESWGLETGGGGSILAIPALRERKEDLPMLAGRFLEIFTADSGFPLPELSPTALEALKAYPWPGNIRELKECISWALERCDTKAIKVGDLPPAIRGALRKQPEPSISARLFAMENELLEEELARQNGNMTRTARALGLTPRQVSLRVRKYRIDPEAFRT